MNKFEINHLPEGNVENKNEKITRQVRDIILASVKIPCSISFYNHAFDEAAHQYQLGETAWPHWKKDLLKEMQRQNLVEKLEKSGKKTSPYSKGFIKRSEKESAFLTKSHPDP